MVKELPALGYLYNNVCNDVTCAGMPAEYSYTKTTISLDGLCDDARHIACANNLNLNYIFARARAYSSVR